MAIVYPNLGDAWLLADLTQGHDPADFPWQVHLFKNDITPDRDTVLGDFVEADFPGYAPFDLERDQWQTPQIIGTTAYIAYGTALISWIATSLIQRVYGWYVTPQTGGVALFTERSPNFVDVSATVPFLLRLSLSSRGTYPL